MNAKLAELRARLQEISDLDAIGHLLHWDQSTYMPPGGASARGRQMAAVSRLAHERQTDPALGRLLENMAPIAVDDDADSDVRALIRVARRDFERAMRIPASFKARLAEHQAASYQAWTTARPANDFAAVAPQLEKTLDLSRELSGFYPGYAHIADPLIDEADEGLTVEDIRPIFSALGAELVPLVNEIGCRPQPNDRFLHGRFPENDQLSFGKQIITLFGYDFTRGRQDKTHHPFMTKFSLGDVRITTRASEIDLAEALFSTLHEAGHALYEQHIDAEYEGSPLAVGASSSLHESQSRLWENIVGRSNGFWTRFYPELHARFPQQLADVTVCEFYRAINRVQPSLIRTDADEVTYNLHVMIRFDLELALLEGKLTVRDLPEAWRERYRSDLGVVPTDDRDGVLQDVHWFAGTIGGAFHCYTLGNVLAAQIYDAALHQHPNIPQQIAAGEFATLRHWLTEKVYRHGRKYPPSELITRATGSPLRIEPYVSYLRTKFGELYEL